MELWKHLVDGPHGPAARAFSRDVVAPVADDIDARDVYPTELVNLTAARGWNTLSLPEHYGGAGLTMKELLSVFEELSVGSASLGISLITIFQSQKIIELYGSDSLKERWLPAYAGGLRASYALTEGGHGSDIRTLDTKARQTDDGWAIKGEKVFITSGSAAQLFVVLAETARGVSVFVVPRDAAGVEIRETEDAETFGLRNGPHVNLVLNDVEVPSDALVGEQGNGLKQALVTLSHSRTLAAGISLGIGRAAFDAALRFAAGRSAFGGKVVDFQGIQWYFAELSAELDAARLVAYAAAEDLDSGREYQRSSSVAKLLASETATRAAMKAVQICGARGTMMSAPFGRYLRDAKAYEVAGGSSEILKNTIAKSLIKAIEVEG